MPRREFRNAVAINPLGINIARSIGSAACDILLGAVGAAASYGVDVAPACSSLRR
ncbi:MFS transporter [Chenggangzhangella methanolivorans]|uniref:MFS transporter n=1 Tax=Chenggangzhangella methanolivorans TaxID=1437009 RepID=UPI003D184A5E